ncbi:head-tail joining protein [Novosphingobium sp. PhB55]|nr:head-tail joining protein [Novosphingobium sp. PhB55]
MSAGPRDKLVTLQRRSSGQDEYGEDVPASYSDVSQEWARFFWGRGSERREAAQMQSQQAATIQVLDNGNTRSMRARDRIVLGELNFDIAAPGLPITRGELEFTATAATS